MIADNGNMTGATWADGDLNGDGMVDMDDLDLAYAQYGLALSVVSYRKANLAKTPFSLSEKASYR